MRTCPKCGCYIPDNWTTCPACSSITTTTENIFSTYRVDVFYNHERARTQQFFGLRETAYSYAQRKAQAIDVYATQVVCDGKIIATFIY